jgi:hypothetical protein
VRVFKGGVDQRGGHDQESLAQAEAKKVAIIASVVDREEIEPTTPGTSSPVDRFLPIKNLKVGYPSGYHSQRSKQPRGPVVLSPPATI